MAAYRSSVRSQEPCKATICQARRSRRVEIVEFFMARQGQRFSSGELHARFGPAFRTRVSEINHDSACPVRIVNETTSDRDGNGRPCERSFYQAERRIREDHSSESGAPAQAGVDDWFVRATGKPRPRTDASGNPLLFVETRA